MTKSNEIKLFKDIVLRFAQESHCISHKVACIAVKDGRIISTGINGTLKGMINCDEVKWTDENGMLINHHDWSNRYELHAEQNMIINAVKHGINLTDSDIYVTMTPCLYCAKMIAGIKPKNIYYIDEYDKSDLDAMKELFEHNIIYCGKI